MGQAVRALSLLHLCFVREPEAPDLYVLGFGVSVRRSSVALLTRVVDNDDLLPTIAKPVLITHGALDAIVRPEAVAQHHASLPHAQHMLGHVLPRVGGLQEAVKQFEKAEKLHDAYERQGQQIAARLEAAFEQLHHLLDWRAVRHGA